MSAHKPSKPAARTSTARLPGRTLAPTTATKRTKVPSARERLRDPARARAAILDSAKRIFNRDGYFATNSNVIARDAGYAPGTFYTHFSDKRAAFLAAYENWVGEEWALIRKAIDARGAAKDRIARAIEALAHHHRRTREFRKSLRALAAIEPLVRHAQNAQRKLQAKWLEELCAREGWRRPNKSICAIVLFALERVLDAISEDDASALDAQPRQTVGELARIVYGLLSGQGHAGLPE